MITIKLLESCQKGLDIAARTGNKTDQAALLSNLASVYYDKDELTKALELYQQVIAIYTKTGTSTLSIRI